MAFANHIVDYIERNLEESPERVLRRISKAVQTEMRRRTAIKAQTIQQSLDLSQASMAFVYEKLTQEQVSHVKAENKQANMRWMHALEDEASDSGRNMDSVQYYIQDDPKVAKAITAIRDMAKNIS